MAYMAYIIPTSSKIPDFFTRRRRGDRKRAIFMIFGVGVLSIGYSLHRTPDLHAKTWIISGDVVDVPFVVIDPHK